VTKDAPIRDAFETLRATEPRSGLGRTSSKDKALGQTKVTRV
jgi:hypothetical protein